MRAEQAALSANGCVLCAAGSDPTLAQHTVAADAAAAAWVPPWAPRPYSVLVAPHSHTGGFADAVRLLRDVTAALRAVTGADSYNVVAHAGAHGGDFHWHAHVEPNPTQKCTLGTYTGRWVNRSDPAACAEQLRDAAAAPVSAAA